MNVDRTTENNTVPKDDSRGLLVPGVAATLAVGVALALAVFLFLRGREDVALEQAFINLTDLHVASLEREIDVNLAVLRGLRDFLVAQPDSTRRQFSLYARDPADWLKSIQALEWIPRVADKERPGYENAARSAGLSGFRFTERRGQGEMVEAVRRDEYFPVWYVEPLAGNEAALGFDLASDPSRLTALVQSRDNGKSLATAPIRLVQETAQGLGFLVFMPVFDGPAESIDQRRQNLRGFVLGVYRLGDIFQAALAKSQLGIGKIALRVTDRAAAKDRRLLHSSEPVQGGSGLSDFSYRRSLDVIGRPWVVEARPTDTFVSQHRDTAPYLASVLVLIVAFALAMYFALLNNRTRAVRRLARTRTSALEKSESRLRAVLDTAVNAIITIDAGGNIHLFNPGAERMFGYRAEEVRGQNVKMLMPDPYRTEHDGYISRYRASRNPHIIGIGREVEGQRKDGSTFPIHLSVGESRIEGESLFVGVISDITFQKQAEQALVVAKEEAEESSRLKSEFVNMMSHELRTPLTVILGYLPVLQNREKMPRPELIAGIAQDIQASGDHLLQLINDLLDISKIEAGKLELNREWLPLREVVDLALAALSPKAALKGIELTSQVDDGAVFADRVRIQQILLNLINNAVKFTDRGGVEVTAKRDGNTARISVNDTGCGISEADLPVIFEKFRQADSSSTRAAGGSGLGLAITRCLVELQDGEISVQSRLGEGSRFGITIPDHPLPNGEDKD